MAGKFKVVGTKTQISFTYEALTSKIQLIINDVAESLWIEKADENGVTINPFINATNQDKLDIVDIYIKRVILEKANSWKSNKAQKSARDNEKSKEYVI